MRKIFVSTLLAWGLCVASSAQTTSTPSTFRLVTPKGPGGITVDTKGWTIERLTLNDHDTRAILSLKNEALGLFASYILSNDETFDYNKESCKNDVLGPIVQDVLKSATLRNLRNASRPLPTGQTLDIGSYFVVKDQGLDLNQQNVFGFISHNHTCAEIHLSRTPFKDGEEHLFDATLDSFRFDPAYVPTSSDYEAMAALLPPVMASAYRAGPAKVSPTAEEVGTGQSLSFALPNRPGYVHMDAPGFAISELSAKPNGLEYGIRAKDRDISGAEALGFLFVPEPRQPTAVACRDWMLRSEKVDGATRKILKTYESASAAGVPVAIVDYEQPKAPSSSRMVRRFFAANSDLCLDVAVSVSNPIAMGSGDDLIKTLIFDANRAPDFNAIFRYATVVFQHDNPAAAAPLYEKALALVNQTSDPQKWRRVATDQASMAYGMAGDLKHSANLNRAAIARDPEYPMYYYNLACADAESGDAKAAREHLQQAFDRRGNVLQGEKLPNPATDDSLLKLKDNKEFWTFVLALPKP